MNKIISSFAAILLTAACLTSTGCSDFEPKGCPELPALTPAADLKASVDGYVVNLSWNLPAAGDIEGVQLIRDGHSSNPTVIDGRATAYSVVGQSMGQTCLYTVKVLYSGGYVSEGVSVEASVPEITLAGVSGLKASVDGRTVTLDWNLPAAGAITGVRILRDSEYVTTVDGRASSCVLRGQPMDRELTYTAEVIYDSYYTSAPASVKALIPYITPKMGYLMLASSISALPDDDERAAATWFAAQENAEMLTVAQLPDIDTDLYPVLWIEIDRVGLPLGWENLPSEVSSPEAIEAIRAYTAKGGNLYLANMATQLTVPLGIVPADMAPTVYGNGDGGSGNDVWVINPYLGWDFRNGSDQGFYDRTAHAIYKGLTLEDPNGYGYETLPLIGAGQREDHNCMWDCNIYGRGNQTDVIRNFEVTTNSMVLATWGHVRDHCVAGLVEFYANAEHGRCIANGFAAYEWNQNSGANPYQHNVEQLTRNILEYLK